MVGVGKGASHLNLNSGTSETCGTGATDDCLNLAGGADEDPGNDKFCELSDLLSYASHLSYTSQWAKHSPFSTLYSLLTQRQNLLFAVAHCTVERRSCVILRGTAAAYAILRIWL